MTNENIKITEAMIGDRQSRAVISTLKCKRCPHVWVLRRAKLPKVCPKCKSPYWSKLKGWAKDKPRGVFNMKERKKPKA